MSATRIFLFIVFHWHCFSYMKNQFLCKIFTSNRTFGAQSAGFAHFGLFLPIFRQNGPQKYFDRHFQKINTLKYKFFYGESVCKDKGYLCLCFWVAGFWLAEVLFDGRCFLSFCFAVQAQIWLLDWLPMRIWQATWCTSHRGGLILNLQLKKVQFDVIF